MKKTKDDYSIVAVIGEGAYSKVFLVKDKTNLLRYAMKTISKKKLKQNDPKPLIERNIMASVDHPFIIKLHHSFQSEKKLYFILEYCQGGAIYNLLKKKNRLSEDVTRFYSAQIVLGLECLHENNILYRDLKSENVLMDLQGYIRLADFGLSKLIIKDKTNSQSICGTPGYIAPEVLQQKGYGKPADWWALGCLIYELLTGIPPFYSDNQNELFNKTINDQVVFPQFLSKICIDLLQKLLQKNPENRLGSKLGIIEIKQHPWFININWDLLLKKQYRPPFIPIANDIPNFQVVEYNEDQFTDSYGDSSKNSQLLQYTGFSYNLNSQNSQNAAQQTIAKQEEQKTDNFK